MTTYYVHIPGSEAPTAEVEASSTKHARTAYLDYFSRSGIISWQQRQSTRRLVKVNRMQPGEIQTQIKLEYGAKEAPVQEVVPPPMQRKPEPGEDIGVEPTYEDLGPPLEEEVQYQPQQQAQPQPRRDPLANSPIIQLSRKSRGI